MAEGAGLVLPVTKRGKEGFSVLSQSVVSGADLLARGLSRYASRRGRHVSCKRKQP